MTLKGRSGQPPFTAASAIVFSEARQGSTSAASPLAPAQNQNPDTQTSLPHSIKGPLPAHPAVPCPAPPTATSPSPVASDFHSAPWPTTPRYVRRRGAPHVFIYPTPRPCSLPLRPGPPNFPPASVATSTDRFVCSMSTPSRAPMPVPQPPTPCSALP